MAVNGNALGTIGFVGIGNMGAPMIRALATSGFSVRAFDTRADAAAAVRDIPGVTVAASLADLARDLSVVITMLPDGQVVQAAALGGQGRDGFAASMARGGIVIDMSSSFPLDTRATAERVASLGLTVVDAPVSGGVGKAVTATLAIMAGGASADIDRVEPVLTAMGTIHRTGALGSGHAMKVLNNYVSAAGLIATAEALVVGQRFGLDPGVMTAVLNASTGRNNTTENKVERFMISNAFNSGFALALMHKDVAMADRLASDLGQPTKSLPQVTETLRQALQQLGSSADHTEIYKYARDLTGHDLTSKATRGG